MGFSCYGISCVNPGFLAGKELFFKQDKLTLRPYKYLMYSRQKRSKSETNFHHSIYSMGRQIGCSMGSGRITINRVIGPGTCRFLMALAQLTTKSHFRSVEFPGCHGQTPA